MSILNVVKRETKKQRFEREAMPLLDSVYRFALSRTGDSVEADDLVQETYMKAWDAWDSYETGTNCRAWLCRILRNTHINRIRSSAREFAVDELPESPSGEGLPGWSYFDSETQENAAWLRFTRHEIEKAFEKLPADFRSVVELADVEGFSYKEIADIMNTPIGTVMSRLYRGRRILRELLIGVAPSDQGGTVEEDSNILEFSRRVANGRDFGARGARHE